MVSVHLTIHLSVYHMPQPNLTTERPRKLKIGSIEAHHTSNPYGIYLFRGQKVKGQGQLILSPKVCHIYKLQTWYTDGAQRPVSPTSAMTKVKVAMLHGASDRCSAKVDNKNLINIKIGRNVAHPQAIKHTSFKVKRSNIKVNRQINVRAANAMLM